MPFLISILLYNPFIIFCPPREYDARIGGKQYTFDPTKHIMKKLQPNAQTLRVSYISTMESHARILGRRYTFDPTKAHHMT